MVEEHHTSSHILPCRHAIDWAAELDLAFLDGCKYGIAVGPYEARHRVSFLAAVLEGESVDRGLQRATGPDLID